MRAILDADPTAPGACPPVGPCREFDNCADIMTQFVDIPVLPDYPGGFQDWVCGAFPDEEKPVDSFIVGCARV